MVSLFLHFRLVPDYLSNKHKRTKINHAYGSLEKVIIGVPEGLVQFWKMSFDLKLR